MTSSLHRNFRGRAFTLIELMVVIGLIVLLIAIAVPMVTRAHRNSMRTAMAADLAILAQGLEAYKADFGDYPRRASSPANPQPPGAVLLCWALVAPGPIGDDGVDGPGFRTRGQTGAVKGPYIPADRFTMAQYFNGSPVNPPPIVLNDKLTILVDRYQHPILYFPGNKAADPYATTGVPGGAYVNNQGSSQATFNYLDNNDSPGGLSMFCLDVTPNKLSREVMCWRLGATGKIPPDGTLRPADVPVTTGPYLLWSCGNDGLFGTNDDLANAGSDLQLNTTTVPF